jgi:SNF2 family DNA or RNA helicase
MLLSEYPYPGVEKPFLHQVETVKFCLLNKRGYVLNGMGTGKTMSVLWASDILYIMNKISKVLIVTPLSTMDVVWGREIRNRMPHRTYRVLHGSMEYRLEQLSKPAHYYIINHDAVRLERMERALTKAKFDLCIIDEMTAYKNASSKRSRALRAITEDCKAVWGMSGSPTANSPLDAFGQARLVNPANVSRYFTHFRDATMMQMDMYTYVPKRGWELVVAKALSPAIRYNLRDCIDLPPTTEQEREIKMSKEQQALYDKMQEHFYAEYQNGTITASNAGVKALKLLQISSGCVYDDTQLVKTIDNTPKFSELLDIYYENGADKILVFATFKAAVYSIEKFFHTEGISCSSITGDTPKSERNKIYESFQNGSLKAIAAQPSTVSHGLNLTAGRLIVWFTPIPSNETFIQANARIVRPGQERSQIIVYMHNSKAERRVYAALRNKEKMSSALLDIFKR